MSEVDGNINKKPVSWPLFAIVGLTCDKNKHDHFIAAFFSAQNIAALI